MIKKYRTVSIVYGKSGSEYAKILNDKINKLHYSQRYPIKSKIVMDSILNSEILDSVTELFNETDICIGILTADDYCIENGTERLRLRQNVIMELGMALFHLGREKCNLIGNFNRYNPKYDLPSDMNSIDIKEFNTENVESVFDDVIKKILKISKEDKKEAPRYDNLLTRKKYRIDYENLFSEKIEYNPSNHKNYSTCVMDYFFKECESLEHFDERAIYLLERIGLLFAFGLCGDDYDWYRNMNRKLNTYSGADADYYDDINIIKNTQKILEYALEYSSIKSNTERQPDEFDFDDLCAKFKEIKTDELYKLNPIIPVIYYDYMGLAYMKLYGFTHNIKDLETAKNCFEKIVSDYVDKIDLELEIWRGFAQYNLGRAYDLLYDLGQDYSDKAIKAMYHATLARKKWVDNQYFGENVKHILSYEYFICKLDYINLLNKYQHKTKEYIKSSLDKIEGEIDIFCNKDSQLKSLSNVKNKLNKYRNLLG